MRPGPAEAGLILGVSGPTGRASLGRSGPVFKLDIFDDDDDDDDDDGIYKLSHCESSTTVHFMK